MSWQDAVFASAQVVFIVALLPAIRSDQKPPFVTCMATMLAMIAILVAVSSLGLWFSTLVTAITATQWCILAYQTFRTSVRKH